MRRHLRAIVVAFVLTFIAAAVQPTAFAQSTWPVDISAVQGRQIVSGADGSITAFRCDRQQSSRPLAQTRNAPGQVVNSAHDQAVGCASGVVGSGNTIYVTSAEQETSAEYTTAFRNHQRIWHKQWFAPCESAAGQAKPLNILWREVGPDRHLYEVLSDGACGGDKLYLHKLDTSNGREVYRQALDIQVFYRAMMTRLGIVFLTITYDYALHYYSLQGNKLKTVPVDSSLSWNTYAAADDGRVYIAHEERVDPQGTCPNFGFQTASISGYDRLGKFFNYRPMKCKRVVSIAPTSNGNLVVGIVDAADRYMVVSYAPNGGMRFLTLPQRRSDGKWFGVWGTGIVADTNGHVVLRRSTYSDESEQQGTFSETYQVLNSTTLATLATAQTDTFSRAYTPDWELGFAMSPGRLYLALNEPCQQTPCPRKLHAVPFGGVGLDYPRGAVLTAGPASASVRYVALGDSFSSGEGNEPFMDSSGCHRSVGAFPRWLDADTSLPLSLANEDFMACSGATVADIRNGKNGEPSQLNRIPSDARVITISVGGNDAKFGDFARVCIRYECDVNSEQYLIAANVIDGPLRQNLTGLYKDILVKAPRAHLYVVGYPYIIPIIEERGTYCPYMSDNELSAARILTAGLNLRAHQATKDIQALEARQRIHFVDPTLSNSPFNGHDVCGKSSFFHRANPVYEEYTFHPDANGAKAYKQIVKAALGY